MSNKNDSSTDFPEAEAREAAKQYCQDNRFYEHDIEHSFYTGYRAAWAEAQGEIAVLHANLRGMRDLAHDTEAKLKIATKALEFYAAGGSQVAQDTLAKIRGENE